MSRDAPRIVLRGIEKRYAVGGPAYGTLRDRLRPAARRPRAHIDALSGIDLEVPPGMAMGVVGPNGAGKSTLLKILARITPPDAGHATIRGRLAALIELGAGFHPELRASENVLLHGSILGHARRDLRRALPAILDYAGVAAHQDLPVKHFSTGMYARLGFAVAVHGDPRVLLVDEVLSVGDQAFRARCHDTIARLARDGTSLLLVSHDLPTVATWCQAAVRLEAGRIVDQGAAADVAARYGADHPKPGQGAAV